MTSLRTFVCLSTEAILRSLQHNKLRSVQFTLLTVVVPVWSPIHTNPFAYKFYGNMKKRQRKKGVGMTGKKIPKEKWPMEKKAKGKKGKMLQFIFF